MTGSTVPETLDERQKDDPASADGPELEADTAQEALAQATAIQDRFLAMLSHELRTPLTPALISISQLQHVVHDEFANDPRLSGHVAVAKRSLETEVRLIDELLDLFRINRGRLRLHYGKFDLHQSLRDVASVFRPMAEAKGLNLATQLVSTPAIVKGDQARIEQTIWNVLDNAVKFTASGGVHVSTCMTDEGTVRLKVADTGIGISQEALPRVFFAFEQGSRGEDADADDNESRYGRTRIAGLGLGLAISKALIDMHGGRLLARSRGVGRGATFFIELDLVDAPSVPCDASGKGGLTPCEATDTSDQARILLVDDHADTVSAMSRLLRRFGHLVESVGTVEEAVSRVGESSFDVLISDIGLPDGTGIDLIGQVPEKLRRRSIAVSGFGSPSDKRESAAAGFREHLVKPITLEALNSAVKRVLASGSGEADDDS